MWNEAEVILLLQAMASKSGRMPPLLARTMKHLYASHKEALQVVMVMPSMCPELVRCSLANIPKRKAKIHNASCGIFTSCLEEALCFQVMVMKLILTPCNY